MKISIIYNSLEWCEQQMNKILQEKGHSVTFQYVNALSSNGFDLVFNRVMPSVASKDPNFFSSIYLDYLEKLERRGVKVINSLAASRADIDKTFSADCMIKYGIPTPKTYNAKVRSIDEIIQELGFPMIRKPSMSGRSNGIVKCNNADELFEIISLDEKINGHVIIQEYIESVKPYDYRLLVCKGKVLFASTRNLVNGWMGSISKGSKAYQLTEIPPEIENLAIKATNSIAATINGVDIIMGEDGPVVIENNPTPNFRESYIGMLGFNPIERIINLIFNKH